MTVKPLCPRCGNVVIKRGTANGDIKRGQGQQRYFCQPCNWHGTVLANRDEIERQGVDRATSEGLHRKVKKAKGVQRYVVTAAQNATAVNKAFFASLLGYAKHRKAQLIVIPYRYKNPTSMWSAAAENDDWWAPELAPYLLDIRTRLNKHLVLLADIKTQPTASSPLMGFETLTGPDSAIIGHPKLELVTVPTPQQRLPKILTTTGAVTEKNYIPAKAGKKAEHHHTFGACVVEVDGGRFHMRQINATRDGSFYDLDSHYDGGQVRSGIPLAALVMGDAHIEFIDPDAALATFGKRGIVTTLKPRKIVWHDVHDFYSRNHHHRGEVFINYVKHHTGRDNVEQWLDHTFAFVDNVTPPGVENIFVPSNHPDALARWVKETDPRSDPENCVFWAKTFTAMCEGAKWTDSGARTIDPFAYWAVRKLKTAKQARFLGRDESYLICGIECGYHGDKGANGSRGTLGSFTRIGAKTVTGHGHSPGIKDGAYRIGTKSRLNLEYNIGSPSSWLHTDCLIYENGKRSLVNIIDGEWRA